MRQIYNNLYSIKPVVKAIINVFTSHVLLDLRVEEHIRRAGGAFRKSNRLCSKWHTYELLTAQYTVHTAYYFLKNSA